MYKKRAASRYQEARTLFVSEHLLAAEKFRTQGKCVETRREADDIAKVDPANQLIKELVKLCKPAPGRRHAGGCRGSDHDACARQRRRA